MSDDPSNTEWRPVLERYPRPFHPGRVEYLGGAGGYSGARFWRLTTSSGPYCLRRWPREHPPAGRLAQIHRVLDNVCRAGCPLVPVPLRALDNRTIVEHDGHLWELTPWLPGEADYFARPTRDKLVNAARALAGFHRAAETSVADAGQPLPSPGLGQRYEKMLHLQKESVARVRSLLSKVNWPGLVPRAAAILDSFETLAPRLAPVLRDACRTPLGLQPCIRDIWHDHVLFDGNEVSGLVDFGAMQTDSIVGDIARLFGSLVGDDAAGWEAALNAYESMRPLSKTERALISVFDRSAVVLSGMNWLWWICVERREFEGHDRILARLDVTIQRLRRLTEEGW